ncbi:hypothetical protein [Ochrobactrum sp. RH2CCR150]|nr:p-aminobenzoyl-glutamate transporter AbgT [Ochrobactrum sp. RH2CCR150]
MKYLATTSRSMETIADRMTLFIVMSFVTQREVTILLRSDKGAIAAL